MAAVWNTTLRRRATVTAWRRFQAALHAQKTGLVFANLVDFDMLYGHRKDVEGFAKSLEEFDALLASLLRVMAPRDLLMITADHGCDPDPRVADNGTTRREYVPIVTFSPEGKRGVNLGIRDTFGRHGPDHRRKFLAAIFLTARVFCD